jgi:hypothetical protein
LRAAQQAYLLMAHHHYIFKATPTSSTCRNHLHPSPMTTTSLPQQSTLVLTTVQQQHRILTLSTISQFQTVMTVA